MVKLIVNAAEANGFDTDFLQWKFGQPFDDIWDIGGCLDKVTAVVFANRDQ